MNPAMHNPRGIRVEVTAPRWPLRLAMIGAGLLLLLMVVAGLGAALFRSESSTSAALHGSVSTLTLTGERYRANVRFELLGDGEPVDLRRWTLLYEDGSLAQGTVVQGPARLSTGVAELVIEFPAQAGVGPAWVRFHNPPGPPVSFPVTVGQP